ncbi:amino acid ABC transporter permease [Pseudoroseicyclus aestuarii]|uniref:Amino acid ABC transporter membrane protein 1 (PAAT family) n=1 Tax=Pseudoroseicyclus aestuarii TaxID=1795041 RepID=A0A318SSW4_9RHOB|nr:ABC transporter permease subunit [Pseudoroseicyclus aestuarii]PYE81207.1 amino acid ABC transporter membrane protein 1 (PAAT family) [Pseudoroseicyclus aestuarii]
MLRSLWFSSRVRGWAAQAAFLGGLLAMLWWLAGNTAQNLAIRGIRTGFDYLSRPTGFPISESVVRYSPSDSYFWAYVVGVTNTLGLFVGLARRSEHPLLSRMADIYVTLMRNIPVVVQLLFWYGIAISLFPPPAQALNPLPGLFLTLRGVYAPSLVLGPWGGVLIAACLVLAIATIVLMRRPQAAALRLPVRIAVGIAGWIVAAWGLSVLLSHPLSLQSPELRGLNFTGGLQLSPEFAAIIFGLTIYTAAYIGEIIRGGIEAVGKGQWEGGRALGLTERQIMFKVILPQALRVIVPPLTSQYLSTVKNTTLAVAVGYPELGLVVNTVINQTGQAIESILVMLGVFLTISLSVSLFMNWYNARVALVSR